MFYAALLLASIAAYAFRVFGGLGEIAWEQLLFIQMALLIAIPVLKAVEIAWNWPDQPWIRHFREKKP